MMSSEEMEYVQKLERTVAEQAELIAELKERIEELERRLHMNSSNSSVPPSQDGFKRPKNRSLRQPSGNKPGGQQGHKGSGLKLPHKADTIETCTPKECSNCPHASECVGHTVERRYKIEAEIELKVHEYDQMEYVCPLRDNSVIRGEFPKDITATKQYGNKLKALVIALNNEGAVSVNRIHDLLSALTSASVSTGFIHNTIKDFSASLDSPLEYIKGSLLASPILHGDETGLRANKALVWLHNASNNLFTYQDVSQKRGKAGIEEASVLPNYAGTLIHDCWRPYWTFIAVRHGICLAHILRELKGILDNWPEQRWAKWLIDLFCEMKRVKERLLAKGVEKASRYYLQKFKSEWDLYIFSGKLHNPITYAKDGVGEKRNKARCLVDRLEKYADAAWLFFRDFNVPFDNNQAERDVRPAKTKIKVSGCFRTLTGAKDFARIHSVLSTTKKHGQNIFTMILALLEGHEFAPLLGY